MTWSGRVVWGRLEGLQVIVVEAREGVVVRMMGAVWTGGRVIVGTAEREEEVDGVDDEVAMGSSYDRGAVQGDERRPAGRQR